MTAQDRDYMAKQIYEAASLVTFANTGELPFLVDPDMYQQCLTELAFIAKALKEIRDKGFGKDVQPMTYAK